MKFKEKNPPRKFKVGDDSIEISDCGSMHLEPDEMVTFVTGTEKQYDFAAKNWGYYATPSVNGRLLDEGFKTALVRNEAGRHYVMVVDNQKLNEFEEYLQSSNQNVIEWLDER
jgi:hypothetical protein